MKVDLIKRLAFALAIVLSISSCSSSTNVAEGGIGGTGISMGAVSNVGSIWVNGVEYDTTGATIIFADDGIQDIDVRGEAGGTTVLPGMVVTVKGTINADGVTGTATTVSYADNLEGPITAIPNTNTMLVLGQTVIIDNLTKDENGVVVNDTSAYSVDGWVEVSGFLDAGGRIHATYIEKKTASNYLELKGTISIVDSSSFTIGGLTVVVADTTGLVDGDFVEIKGLLDNLNTTGDTLTASSVELKSAVLDTEDYDEAEMEGIVTSVVMPEMEFFLGTQRVQIDSGAEFNGGLATDIVPGVRLEVEGSLVAGVLIAKEISFEDGIELEANIQSKDDINKILTLAGLATSGGLNLQVKVDDVLTEFEGVTQFADLNIGNHVQIRARDVGTGLLATKLVVSVTDPAITLQGPLEAKDQITNSVTVLGIEASGFGGYEIDSVGSVDQATFFSTVKLDDLVDLRGTWNGTTITWDSIELDD